MRVFIPIVASLLAVAGCSEPPPEQLSQDTGNSASRAALAGAPLVTIYKSPTCGCCANWVEHLQENGFRTEVHDSNELGSVKSEHAVPPDLSACHTALVDGYVVEGHVPAETIRKLLAERPRVAGVAVPGMPMGSPGMEGPYSESYQVLTFTVQGETGVYATY
ncbi:MAG: DUF411 domain-containing protein [Longimicrobiaceae bacterium]